ncbi:MAG: hypothetical protein JJU05_08535 [Verrucomicrobia bacterium]|nr:hypothetical protein [Verrucomicrobiota bacterium]MCH8527347.1 hypothetical protein [Kiritimatiellia bacterium]
MKPIYFIHIGYPKTATTTLQRTLFQNADSLYYLGKPFSAENIKRLEQALLLGGDLFDQALNEKDVLLKEITNCGCSKVLISQEGFVRNTRYGKGFESEGHNIEDTASRIFTYFSSLTEDKNTPPQIIITLRSQYSLLPSYHSYFVPELSWKKYLNTCVIGEQRGFAKALDYKRVLNTYSSLFGEENIHVFLYEDFIQNPVRFISDIGNLLGISNSTLLNKAHKEKLNPSNTSASGWHRDRRWIRKIQRFPMGKSFLKISEKTLPGEFWSYLSKQLTQPLTPDERKAVDSIYGKGNRMVAERFKLDLKSVGYPYKDD